MAITYLVDLTKYRFNNRVRKVEALTLNVDAFANRTSKYRLVEGSGLINQGGGRKYIRTTDTLAIGILPKKSMLLGVKVFFEDAFPADTTFDLGFVSDFPTDDLITMQADIKADEQYIVRYSGVNISGVRQPDADIQIEQDESDYRGALWNGNERPLILGLTVKNAGLADNTELKTGKCTFVVTYVRYGDEDIHLGEELTLKGYYDRFSTT